MKITSFLTNKYTLSVFILLFCLGVDILLHKGITRVILPESFTAQRTAGTYESCDKPLVVKDKKWVKGINTIGKLQQLDTLLAGFEVDVYFDTSKNSFLVYHDSTVISNLDLQDILQLYQSRQMTASLWLDFKNLSAENLQQSVRHVLGLRSRFGLQNKIIVESSKPALLQAYCDNGFFTSYYLPFFNPYLLKEKELVSTIDKINDDLKKYKVSALSGYYFQYPVVKKYFPSYPFLTWTDNPAISLVAHSLNRSLLNDAHVKIVLYPE